MLLQQNYRTIVTKQNFKRLTPSLTWTLKLRSIWLYRNIFILLAIRQKLNISKVPYWNWIQTNSMRNFLSDYLLQYKLYQLLSQICLKSYTIRISNFGKSCDYWALANGNNYFEIKTEQTKVTTPMNPVWYSLYLKPWTLLGIFTSKKIYKIQLIKFIHLLVDHWQALNTSRLYYSGYPIITKNWLVLRFLGTYYFKTLNF